MTLMIFYETDKIAVIVLTVDGSEDECCITTLVHGFATARDPCITFTGGGADCFLSGLFNVR